MAITLKDFLTSLVTENVRVVIKDADLKFVGKIYADTVERLGEDVYSREVTQWEVIRNTHIVVHLGDVIIIDKIPVTGVEFNEESISLHKGETGKMIAHVLPDNATNKTITWTTSDEDIVTVRNGLISGINAGTATITVITQDGGFTDSCEVEVTDDGTKNASLWKTNLSVDLDSGSEVLNIFIEPNKEF